MSTCPTCGGIRYRVRYFGRDMTECLRCESSWMSWTPRSIAVEIFYWFKRRFA